MQLDNKTYDILKKVVTIWLPAIATLYLAISGVLTANDLPGLPYPEVVTGIMTAVITFLGTVLGISTKNYQGEGTLSVDKNAEGGDQVNLKLNDDLNTLSKKKSITVAIQPTESQN